MNRSDSGTARWYSERARKRRISTAAPGSRGRPSPATLGSSRRPSGDARFGDATFSGSGAGFGGTTFKRLAGSTARGSSKPASSAPCWPTVPDLPGESRCPQGPAAVGALGLAHEFARKARTRAGVPGPPGRGLDSSALGTDTGRVIQRVITSFCGMAECAGQIAVAGERSREAGPGDPSGRGTSCDVSPHDVIANRGRAARCR
jgi:hypothetical protein